MKSRAFIHLAALCLMLLLCAAASAQQQPSDPEVQQLEKTIREAWQEAEEHLKAGGKESDASYPGRKWAATLWQYRLEHPGTPASEHATAEALHFLLHAGQFDEMISKADSVSPADASWKRIIGVLREAADKKKDYDYLIAKSRFLLEKSTEKEIRMRAQFALAQGLWKKGQPDLAREAFRRVIADYPRTQLAREAEGNLHELDALNRGQAAPLFAYRGINGEPVALADFRGKVVLLNFWASWCGVCQQEFSLLKELSARYREQGLAIIGISIDEEAKAFEEAVSKHGLAWPQIRDGKDGQIARLFNVQSTPTNFILNREGRIEAKAVPGAKLKEAVTELMRGSAPPAAETAEDPEASARDKWQKPDQVLKLLNLKPGEVVVDIGAGSGYFTRRFAAAVAPQGKAIGVEIDAAEVRALAADARRLNLANYEARLVPPDDPMLPPQSVDILFLCDAYHHIENRAAYFTKIRESLKPGGRLVVIDFVRSKEHRDHSIVREEVIEELRRAGYRLSREFDLLLPRQYFLEFERVPAQ